MTFPKYLIYADGSLVFHNQEADFQWPPHTERLPMVNGTVLVSVGPSVCNVSIKNAVPKAGSDFPWLKVKESAQPIGIRAIRLGLSSTGDVLTGQFVVSSYSTGSSTSGAPTESVELFSVTPDAPQFEPSNA